MNRLDNSSVSPVYMSQTEANDVMELWARRQREEAERHAMVTVHDVAEATQLTPQEVQRLLQDVRSSQESLTPLPTRPVRNSKALRPEDVPFWLAVYRTLPVFVVLAFAAAFFAENHMYMGAEWVNPYCIFTIMASVAIYLGRFLLIIRDDWKAGRMLRGSRKASSTDWSDHESAR